MVLLLELLVLSACLLECRLTVVELHLYGLDVSEVLLFDLLLVFLVVVLELTDDVLYLVLVPLELQTLLTLHFGQSDGDLSLLLLQLLVTVLALLVQVLLSPVELLSLVGVYLLE